MNDQLKWVIQLAGAALGLLALLEQGRRRGWV